MIQNKILLSILLVIICVIGDNLLKYGKNYGVLKAIYDNVTHGLVGLFSGLIITYHFREKLYHYETIFLILFCYISSSAIDIDHFIEARSFKLHDATSLTKRPFLHCSTIALGIFIIFFVSLKCSKHFRSSIWLSMLLCSILTHHLRDSTRRGLWIWPFGHTKQLPYFLYVIMTAGIPHLLINLLSDYSHKKESLHRVISV